MTHLCSDRVTHTKNRPCPWARSEQAISSTPKACKVFGSAGPSRQLPVCTGPAREQYTTQLSVVVGHFWRAKYGHFSRVPKGYRLTRGAVAAVLAMFAEFDPKGQHSYVINEQMAVIRRVPVWRAEDVAAALVKIAQGCAAAAANGASASAIDSEKRGGQALYER